MCKREEVRVSSVDQAGCFRINAWLKGMLAETRID